MTQRVTDNASLNACANYVDRAPYSVVIITVAQ